MGPRSAILASLTCLLLLCTVGLAAPLQIHSSQLAMTIDPEAGKITQLRDTVAGVDLLSPKTEPSWLLKVQIGKQWVGVWNGKLQSAKATRTAGGGEQIDLSYLVPYQTGQFEITIAIAASPERPDITFLVGFANRVPGLIIDAVHGPEIVLPRQLGDTGTERAFMAAADGVETRMAGLDQIWSVREYPGGLSMQLTAYYDDRTGLAAAAHDTQCEPKSIGVTLSHTYDPQGVHFWIKREVPAEPNAPVASYPVVIYPVRGDWRAAAEPYRDWALQQWWAKPKPAGQQSPDWVGKNPVVIEANLQNEYCGLNLMPIKDYPKILAEWSKELGGATMLPLNRSFERYGTYASPHYLPLLPGDQQLRQLWQDVHQNGHYTMAMVSGLVWQISRPTFISGPSYWNSAISGLVDDGTGKMVDGWSGIAPSGAEVCVVNNDGKVQHEEHTDWTGIRSHMCPGHSYADPARSYPHQVLVSLARKMAELGMDLYEIDQMNGGKTDPCYSPTHGHPIGYGRWQAQTVGRIMADCRAEGRSVNPRFALDMEDPGELWLPHLDMYGCRPQAINAWPALTMGDGSTPTSYTVPAFGFVYGELIRGHSWDQTIHARTFDYDLDVELVRMAKALSHGSNLAFQIAPWQLVNAYAPPPKGWKIADGPYANQYPSDAIAQTPDRAHPVHLAFLKSAARTINGVASAYLNGGRMVTMSPVQIPDFTYSYWDGDAKAMRKRQNPAIYLNAWKQRDGSLLFLLINADRTAQHTIDLPPEIDHRKLAADLPVLVYRNGDLARTTTVADLGTRVRLEPAEVLALELSANVDHR